MELIFKLIDSLPVIRDNWKTIIFLSVSGLIVGFTGYPLWLVYRNEEEVVQFVLSFRQEKKLTHYTKDQLLTIKEELTELLKTTQANRAIFGLIQENNRIIILEVHDPLENQLPLGFQTVYLGTPDYETLLNSLKKENCTVLDSEGGSYIATELKIANAEKYLACPSNSNWFLGLYLPDEDSRAPVVLEESVKRLEIVLP